MSFAEFFRDAREASALDSAILLAVPQNVDLQTVTPEKSLDLSVRGRC